MQTVLSAIHALVVGILPVPPLSSLSKTHSPTFCLRIEGRHLRLSSTQSALFCKAHVTPERNAVLITANYTIMHRIVPPFISRFQRATSRQRGFTLIELLVVI